MQRLLRALGMLLKYDIMYKKSELRNIYHAIFNHINVMAFKFGINLTRNTSKESLTNNVFFESTWTAFSTVQRVENS